MIRIGCTTFREHGSLVDRKEATLYEYAGFFPVVELDTTYYYLPKEKDVRNWVSQVPDNFRFILKVHQSTTGQGEEPEGMSQLELVAAFKKAILPMTERGQLFCLLAQFPNSFKCTKESVAHLKLLRKWFAGLPVAIELRDRSWYDAKHLASMRHFMKEHDFSLVIVDEPKKLATTVPLYPYVTHQNFAMFRFHGRNDAGWTALGPDAKQKRTLYRYSPEELRELQNAIESAGSAKEIAVIFNNNSGGDAAPNALALMKEMKIEYDHLNPSQLDLF